MRLASLYSWSVEYCSYLFLWALAARAHAKYVFPVPGWTDAKTISFSEWCRWSFLSLGLRPAGFPYACSRLHHLPVSSIKILAFLFKIDQVVNPSASISGSTFVFSTILLIIFAAFRFSCSHVFVICITIDVPVAFFDLGLILHRVPKLFSINRSFESQNLIYLYYYPCTLPL